MATTVLAIPAFYFLIGRSCFPDERLDVLAVTSAEVGVVFCTIVLVTGPDLGAAGVGDLVGAGRYSADLDAGAVVDLCELPGAAALFEQRADADAGRGAGGVRRAGCAAGLFLDLVFPNAASAAGDRRRRIDGSAHVACPAD